MNRILFIGHEADRTGAPIVLLHYLQWLKKNKPHYEIDLLLLRSGDLEEEYRKVANVYLLAKNETPSIFQRLTSRLKAKVEIKTEPLQSSPLPRRLIETMTLFWETQSFRLSI
jgi:hypothetical protein